MKHSNLFSQIVFLLLTSSSFACLSCHKDNDDKDKVFFECQMDGVLWLPCVELTFPPDPKLTASTLNGTSLLIEAWRSCGSINDDYFSFSADTIRVNTEMNTQFVRYLKFKDGCDEYRIDSTYNNYYRLTRYDGPYGFIAGEFGMRFISIDKSCHDTIMITDGKFQVRSRN
jgi:hypothetical protein